jgi:hypothetical protein
MKKIENFRKTVSSKIHNVLEGQSAAVATALLTGLRGGISEKATEECDDLDWHTC